MFNGKSCQVGVCDQVGDSLTLLEHLLKDEPMPPGGQDDSRTWLVQPTLYAGK
jgi:hypothetical protein